MAGSPLLAADSKRETYWRLRLNESVYVLFEKDRDVVLQAVLGACSYRGWHPHAIHIRTTHVHAVISGSAKPERMLSDFKAYATRALRSEVKQCPRRRYWADHGSTRYLWNEESVRAAIDYVMNAQGRTMAFYACFD